MPAVTPPTQHPEPADNPDRTGGMSLHDRGVEHFGQHDEVPLGARWPIEHHPLVAVVGVAEKPARQPVGKAASRGKRLLPQRPAGDVEQRPGRPRCRIRLRLENRAAARYASLVDGRSQREIDLLHKHLVEDLGSLGAHPALFEVLGQPP